MDTTTLATGSHRDHIRAFLLIAFVVSSAAGAAAGQNTPPYALYELLPSDVTATTAQSIAAQLKLSLLAPGQQDQSVQLFADKAQYPRMLFESGTVKLFPKLTKTSTTAVSIQDAIPIAQAGLQQYGLLPTGAGLLTVADVVTLSRQTGKRNGKYGKIKDVLRTVQFVRELDGLPVEGANSTLSVDIGKKGVVGFYRALRPVGQNLGQVAIKSEAQATAEFNAQLAQMNIPGAIAVQSVELIYFEQGGSFVQPAYRFIAQTAGDPGTVATFDIVIAAALQTPEPIVMPQQPGTDPTFPPQPVRRGRAARAAGEVKYGRYVIRQDGLGWVGDAKAFGDGLKATNAFRVTFSGFPPVKDEQYWWNYPSMWEFTTDGLPDQSADYVGRVDIALIEGHGLPWKIYTLQNLCTFCCDSGEPKPFPTPPATCTTVCREQTCIDLTGIAGYGGAVTDDLTDYIVWQGCSIIPSPDDPYGGSYQPPAAVLDVWYRMFKGMHGVYGYRTIMNIFNGVGGAFGKDIGYGFQNLSAWFKETDNSYFRHKNGNNYGSTVIVTGHEADRVYDNAPLKLPSSLTMWWAHP